MSFERGKRLTKTIEFIRLLGRPQGATIKEMMEELGLSRSTVYRELNVLERQFGIPLYKEEDTRPNRWKIMPDYLKSPSTLKVPDINLNFMEILSLCLLESHKSYYRGTEIEKSISSAFSKLKMFVPDSLLGKIDKIKSLFIPASKFTKDYKGKEHIIDRLTEAMLSQRRCIAEYHSFTSDEVKKFRIAPLSFFEYNQGLYIFACAEGYDDILTLAVERFKDVCLTSEEFEYPEGFDPNQRLEYAFGIVGGEPVEVKIWFSSEQARYIRERRWVKEQRITTRKDGSIVIRMKISGLYEVMRWVLSYGADAKVLEPESLREKMEEELRKTLKNYEK